MLDPVLLLWSMIFSYLDGRARTREGRQAGVLSKTFFLPARFIPENLARS
jgi:hypothetical protein